VAECVPDVDAAVLRARIDAFAEPLLLGLALYLVVELVLLHFRWRRLGLREARMAGLGLLSGGLLGAAIARVFGVFSVGVAAALGATLSPIEGNLAWPWWIYAWVVYEFWYWVQHWAAHKVRLLWCIHSPHHAPGGIHMLIGANHHCLESVLYFPIFFGLLPAICGVPPVLCVGMNLIDVVWGSFLHISDGVVRRGRYGPLERFLQTPAHHRVHHAKNPRYLDTNYNSITLLWDKLLGTLQPLRDDEPVDYGITREVDTGSFWDVHFGEFRLLARDIMQARSARERLGYLFRPPGWSPTGASKTATDQKRAAGLLAPYR
jgi:sterol desaturase/sphingolipid hydroxylase (fatty acid hydroxylase superfamily)